MHSLLVSFFRLRSLYTGACVINWLWRLFTLPTGFRTAVSVTINNRSVIYNNVFGCVCVCVYDYIKHAPQKACTNENKLN